MSVGRSTSSSRYIQKTSRTPTTTPLTSSRASSSAAPWVRGDRKNCRRTRVCWKNVGSRSPRRFPRTLPNCHRTPSPYRAYFARQKRGDDLIQGTREDTGASASAVNYWNQTPVHRTAELGRDAILVTGAMETSSWLVGG